MMSFMLLLACSLLLGGGKEGGESIYYNQKNVPIKNCYNCKSIYMTHKSDSTVDGTESSARYVV